MAAVITGASLSRIYDRINGAPEYNPMTAETFADWSLEAGDIVTMKRGEDEYEVPVHSSRLVWRGAPQMSLSATGTKEREPLAKVSRQKYGRGSGAKRNDEEENRYIHYVDETNSYWRSVFEDSLCGLHSEIVQTASSIRLYVDDNVNSLHGEIQVTASSIRQYVDDTSNSLHGEIVTTASSVRAYVDDTANSLHGEIVVTSSSIRQYVDDTSNSLHGEITVQAGRIDLVVEGEGTSAAIRINSIVDGINNDSSIELSGDRVYIQSGSSKKKVKVYVDGEINATNGNITNLTTGTTKATLINSTAFNGDTVTGGIVYATTQLSIGSGTQGGSGSLYYRGTAFYSQGLTLGSSGAFIAEGHFLGDSSTTLNMNHYHTIVATEGTGSDAGKIFLELTDPVATSDTSSHITNFNIAATTTYKNGVLAARNAVKVSPFTANTPAYGQLTSSRTFTYTTDAPTPSQETPQMDTWYLTETGWSGHENTVYLAHGSPSGTTYAKLDIDGTSEYEAGQDSVDVVAGEWTTKDVGESGSASVTFSPSAGNGASLDLKVGLYKGSGTPTTGQQTIMVGAKVGTGSTQAVKSMIFSMTKSAWSGNSATMTLDADGTIQCTLPITGPTITLSDTWSNGKITVTSSPAAQADIERTLVEGTASWSGNTATVPINAVWGSSGQYSESTGKSISVNAVGRYYAGSASVVLSDTLSWTTAPSSSINVLQNAVTVSTSGRTNTSGTTDERTKTINLYTQSETSGLKATFYVTQGDSTSGNRIIKRETTCSDGNLTAGNIKNGVTIFGTTGTYKMAISDTLSWTTAPSSSINVLQNGVTMSTTDGYGSKTLNLYTSASTSGLTATFYVTHTNSTDANRIIKRTATCSDSNLTAGNIKNGVTIFGTTGTYKMAISDTLGWTTNPASDINVNQNAVTMSTTDGNGSKTLNLYSQSETSGITTTFYVTHTDSLSTHRIIKRTVTPTLSWSFPSSLSTGSTEPTGTFAKSYSVANSAKWIWMTITVSGESRRIKIHLTS